MSGQNWTRGVMSRVAQVHWLRHLTRSKLVNKATFSQQIGTEGEYYAYDSCRSSLGLSFEPLTAIVRSKLDSVGDVACCSGEFTSAPDGT